MRELSAFGIGQKEHYTAAIVNLKIDTKDKDIMGHNPQPTIVQDTAIALLKIVIANNCLYQFIDKNYQEHFFYSLVYQTPIELVDHQFLLRSENDFIASVKQYKEQIKDLMTLCQNKMYFDADNMGYFEKNMTDFFIKFNECSGCTYVCYRQKPKDKAKFIFGVIGGGYIESSEKYDMTSFSNSNSVIGKPWVFAPSFGMSFSILSKRNLGRNCLYFEALYKIRPVSSTKEPTHKFNIQSLDLCLMYKRYYNLNQNQDLFFGAGAGLKSVISSYPEIVNYLSIPNSSDGLAMYVLASNTAIPIIATIGMTYLNYAFEIRYRYLTTTDVATIFDYKIDPPSYRYAYYGEKDYLSRSSINFLLSYSFGKK